MRSIVYMIQEKDGYLQQTGWLRALRERRAVGASGEDIPKLTYPCIDFLSDRLLSFFRLFGFGCASSVRYYSKHIAFVDVVEHNSQLVPKLTEEEKKKIRVYLTSLEQKERYTNILGYIEKKYHVIIVDGHYRVSCMRSAVHYLTEDGVLILNDSHTSTHLEGKLLMQEKGFRHLDFFGTKVLDYKRSCTTIFYRQNNCMNI